MRSILPVLVLMIPLDWQYLRKTATIVLLGVLGIEIVLDGLHVRYATRKDRMCASTRTIEARKSWYISIGLATMFLQPASSLSFTFVAQYSSTGNTGILGRIQAGYILPHLRLLSLIAPNE